MIKKILLSTITGILLGTTAYTIDFKSKGEILLNYITEDTQEGGLFNSDNSIGDLSVRLRSAVDLGNGILLGGTAAGVTTTGIKDNFVNDSVQKAREGMNSTGITITELFAVKNFKNTTIKIGRQELNTPMFFSEKQYSHSNTYLAALILNKSFENTMLVGGYVDSSNDHEDLSKFDTDNIGGKTGFVGVLYRPRSDLKMNLWYYQIKDTADIVWAEGVYEKDNFKVGVQAANATTLLNAGTTMTSIQGVYDLEEIRFIGAYGKVTMADGAITMENRGTSTGNGRTKLFTQMEENSEYVAGLNNETTTSFKLGARTRLQNVELSFQHGQVNGETKNYEETNLKATTRLYNTDVDLIYVDKKDGFKDLDSQMVKMKLSYQF